MIGVGNRGTVVDRICDAVAVGVGHQHKRALTKLHGSANDAAAVANPEEEGHGRIRCTEVELADANLTGAVDATLKVRWVRVEPAWTVGRVARNADERHLNLVVTSCTPVRVSVGAVAGSEAFAATDADVAVKRARHGDELWVPGTSDGRVDATGERIIVMEHWASAADSLVDVERVEDGVRRAVEVTKQLVLGQSTGNGGGDGVAGEGCLSNARNREASNGNKNNILHM